MQITEQTTATTEALAAVNRLLPELSATAQPLTIEQLSQIVSDRHTHLYIIREGDEAIGMFTLCATLHPCGLTVWLEDVVIAHSHQGQGLGRQLVEAAISEAHHLYPTAKLMLTSRLSRHAANHIYSQLMETKQTNVYQLRPNISKQQITTGKEQLSTETEKIKRAH